MIEMLLFYTFAIVCWAVLVGAIILFFTAIFGLCETVYGSYWEKYIRCDGRCSPLDKRIFKILGFEKK